MQSLVKQKQTIMLLLVLFICLVIIACLVRTLSGSESYSSFDPRSVEISDVKVCIFGEYNRIEDYIAELEINQNPELPKRIREGEYWIFWMQDGRVLMSKAIAAQDYSSLKFEAGCHNWTAVQLVESVPDYPAPNLLPILHLKYK